MIKYRSITSKALEAISTKLTKVPLANTYQDPKIKKYQYSLGSLNQDRKEDANVHESPLLLLLVFCVPGR